MDIVKKIKDEITQDFYLNHFPNDGQRFVAWYLRNIHLLDQLQTKDAITDGPDDKQIDAVYIDDNEQKIFIIQGKFYTGDIVDAEPVREVLFSWVQLQNIQELQITKQNLIIDLIGNGKSLLIVMLSIKFLSLNSSKKMSPNPII